MANRRELARTLRIAAVALLVLLAAVAVAATGGLVAAVILGAAGVVWGPVAAVLLLWGMG